MLDQEDFIYSTERDNDPSTDNAAPNTSRRLGRMMLMLERMVMMLERMVLLTMMLTRR